MIELRQDGSILLEILPRNNRAFGLRNNKLLSESFLKFVADLVVLLFRQHEAPPC
jgi:hypothetical protein